jgi:hypothetical protein
MPKAIDLRVPGLSFEDALRKVFQVQPGSSAKSKFKPATNALPVRKKIKGRRAKHHL